HPFERGLVWREGNKKGAHIIKEKEQAQMCFAMDYQKLVFFPNYANFLEFLRAFMRNNMVNFVEAEQLCHGLLLQPANNPRRMLRFKQFTNVNRHGNNMPKAVMFQIEETFELHELIIKADQKVNVDFLEDTLKEKVLKLNLFPAFQRIELINQQFRRLELDNPCTQAFGIFVYQEMLRGSAEILPPMITVGANNFQLTPFENGSFQLKPQNYFKKAKIDQVIVLASRRDFEKSLNDIQKVMKHLSPNYKQLIEFQEFNLFSQSDEQ
uniref:Uncharacterized protein n=1 Tax=Panagrolaimus sp. ES5 TaxID=591445 RepID=A0AC34GI96_9BILA